MANFAYTALDRSGRQTSGSLAAEARSAVLSQLVGRGLSPISVQELQAGKAGSMVKKGSGSTRVPQSAVEAFTRELANLLGAGLPLSRSLNLLSRECSNPGAKKAWSAILDDVVGGVSLADAMAKFPKAFSTVYVAMVRAGEAGGFLSLVLSQISDFRTREQDLRGKVKAAMVYPIVLAVLGCGVMAFLLTFFIPRFTGIFKNFGAKLPALTQFIVGASNILIHYGYVVAIGLAVAIYLARRAFKSEGGRRAIERTMLAIPAFGAVSARFALVRFCRMLGTLVAAGVPLINSLKVAKEALGNQTLADAVSHAIDEVQRGASLAKSLAVCPQLFPASVVEMVTVAEETGKLDKELIRLSLTFESDLDRQLRLLVSLAEPALLFLMAGLIGTVVIGMLLPLFSLGDVVK
jgi:type II secretory pathway component PulF